MTLIKCPQCGHTVLSVASRCPACSAALNLTFLGPEHGGELAECRSCGHAVRSASRTCPHCGARSPARRRWIFQNTLRASAAFALTVLVIGIWSRAPGGEAVRRAEPSTHEPVKPSVEPEGEPGDRPIEAPADEVVSPAPALQTRWTSVWANVREQPSRDARIVRVLAPGTQVEGARGRYGWWFVQLGDDSVGYIAGSLLLPVAPPDAKGAAGH